ncbi:FYVE-domain-containing protein [Polychaeton citri CBS 116435]|uniref:RING-type E3 ubiquitin transferase n=1 Tax=Polychaeton citri CBS 116435 TaxID=1314669 RepID=A0A9P4Q9Z3_9PEZI|nr:FYVE-domain-containing protein [Polychaeton citri CBS 116435]
MVNDDLDLISGYRTSQQSQPQLDLAPEGHSQQTYSWLEFLQSTTPTTTTDPSSSRTLSASSASSIDRKRRIAHAEAADGRREYPYSINPFGAGGQRDSASAAFYTRSRQAPSCTPIAGPIDQDYYGSYIGASSGARAGELSAGYRQLQRRNSHQSMLSSHELPRWQPDDETSECTVCQTPFGFLNRRHHCRKCGRLVCKLCSPHKITIPRPFIVRPPGFYDDEVDGGEEVRVCKPCVPDPWVPPPSQPVQSPPPVPPSSTRPQPPAFQQSHAGLREEGAHRPLSFPRPDRAQNSDVLPHATARYRSNTHHSRNTSYGPSLGAGQFGSSVPARTSSMQFQHAPMGLPPTANPLGRQLHQHRMSQGNVAPFIPTVGSPSSRPFGQPSHPTPIRLQRPRRQIKEEDECPVCHSELPPGMQAREQHVMNCIENNTAATTSTPPAATAIPVPVPSASTASSSILQTQQAAAIARPRAMSHRPSGLLIFRATEKDCADGEGNPQECVICLEDFGQGEELGRLECWCKFHRICIRGWWEKKGAGSCPTHQLQE